MISSAMAMDFFERQEQAQANSRKIALLFLLALPCVIAAVYAVSIAVYEVTWAFLSFWGSVAAEIQPVTARTPPFFVPLWQPTLLMWVSLVTLLVVACGSLLKVRQLAPGGRVVARLLGGERLSPATKNLEELRLLHVVEEMSVASGTPMPDIYILRREFGLNAFVAGHTVSDMIVAVTEGCVRYLGRDELQGIIAHEYSHILNGDMRLNMRLMGWVHGLFSITLLSYWVMSRTYRERDRDIGGMTTSRTGVGVFVDLVILVIGFLLAFIGWNGAFFGRIIKGAVSRQREFLADAAAVQFTRYPEGLASALKRVKQSPEGSVIHAVHVEEASHIFFCNGLEDDRIWLTSTHPPLGERIKRVETMMGQVFVPEPKIIAEPEPKRRRVEPAKPAPEPFLAKAPVPAEQRERSPVLASALGAVAAARIVSEVGIPTSAHLAYAAKLVESLPESIRQAAREPQQATALIYAVLQSRDENVRAAQLGMLKGETNVEVFEQVHRLVPVIGALDEHARIPVVELTFPALRRLAPEEYAPFTRTIQRLVTADQEVDLFEFALQKMVRRHLEPNFRPATTPEPRYHSLKGLSHACSFVLSALAHSGQDTPEESRVTFQQGADRLGSAAGELKLMPLADCTLNALEVSLDNLSEVTPRLKKQLLDACARTVAADGRIRPREAELLRAIADALDCPIPPIVSKAHV